MSIEYRKGDCLQDSDTKRVIAHVVNNKGGFGKGFALAVANKYPEVKKQYLSWYKESLSEDNLNFYLGRNQFVTVSRELTICNMLAQNGYKSTDNPVSLDYKALEDCLSFVNKHVRLHISIWMPKIGSGLAGGNWNKIEDIINLTLKDREVVIFEL